MMLMINKEVLLTTLNLIMTMLVIVLHSIQMTMIMVMNIAFYRCQVMCWTQAELKMRELSQQVWISS